MKNPEKLGTYLTCSWLFITTLMILLQLNSPKVMTLNEWGDYLAGMMSPIALLWLVIGFYLQREELKQNTKALQIQGEELKNQVEQTRKLVEQTTRQVDIEDQRFQKEKEDNEPNFIFETGAEIFNAGKIRKKELNFVNYGGVAFEVSIESPKPAIFEIRPKRIGAGNTGTIIAQLAKPLEKEIFVILTYKGISGKRYGFRFPIKDLNFDLEKNPPEEFIPEN